MLANPSAFSQRVHDMWFFLILGIVSLGVSAILSLQHRVSAPDCVSSIATFNRKSESGHETEAEEDRNALRKTLKKSAFLLRVSVILLDILSGGIAVGLVEWLNG